MNLYLFIAEHPPPCTIQGRIEWRSCVIDEGALNEGESLLYHLAQKKKISINGGKLETQDRETTNPNRKRYVLLDVSLDGPDYVEPAQTKIEKKPATN